MKYILALIPIVMFGCATTGEVIHVPENLPNSQIELGNKCDTSNGVCILDKPQPVGSRCTCYFSYNTKPSDGVVYKGKP